MNFIIAKRSDRILNIRFTDDWGITLCDYLIDKRYNIFNGSEEHWKRRIDDLGNPALTYDLDKSDNNFDIGE